MTAYLPSLLRIALALLPSKKSGGIGAGAGLEGRLPHRRCGPRLRWYLSYPLERDAFWQSESRMRPRFFQSLHRPDSLKGHQTAGRSSPRDLSILNTVVPHLGHVPFVAGRLLFRIRAVGFRISTLVLHLKQNACSTLFTSFVD